MTPHSHHISLTWHLPHITHHSHNSHLTFRARRNIWWCSVTFRGRRKIWRCCSEHSAPTMAVGVSFCESSNVGKSSGRCKWSSSKVHEQKAVTLDSWSHRSQLAACQPYLCIQGLGSDEVRQVAMSLQSCIVQVILDVKDGICERQPA